MEPEYLTLFSASGPIAVEVKFKDHTGSVAQRFMQPADINKLVGGKDGGFIREMNFDEWPFDIVKYEIDPIRYRLTITARPPKTRRQKPATSAAQQAIAPWSSQLRAETLMRLENLDTFTPDGRLCMKHKSEGYGYFRAEDLVAQRLALHRHGQAEPVQFADFEAVIAAGWAVD